MRKFSGLITALPLCFLISNNLGWADITISTANTTAQTLNSGTLTVTSTGSLTVSGKNPAINVTGTSSIINNNTIKQTGTGRAIRDSTGGLTLNVTNNAGDLIQSTGDDAFQMSATTNASNVTLNNYGTVQAQSAGARAINWSAIGGGNTLNNYSTGLLQAAAGDAVRMGVNGVVTNSGKIYSYEVSGSTSSDGIDAQNNSGIQITNSYGGSIGTGLIEGGRHGITGGALNTSVNYLMTITNNANATIQGDNGSGINIDGFNANETVTVVNHGTITGNGSSLTTGNTTQDGDGVDVDGLVNLNNTGTIKSVNAIGDTSEGVTVGGGTIVNSGTIEGDLASGNTSGATGRGITLAGVDKDASGNTIPTEGIYGNTTVTNSGLIRGQSDSGIAVTGATNSFTVTVTNNTGGVIEGGGATAAALQTGGNDDTVIDYGTIEADASGKAIDLGAGTNSLQILGGSASIIGSISGGSGTSSLVIDPGTGNKFSYSGAISNFNTVQTRSGAVVLSGLNTYAGTTTVSGGAALVTGSHTGAGAYSVDGGMLGGAGGTITTAGGAGISLTATSGSGLDISGMGRGTVGSQNGLVAPGKLTLNLGTGVLDISQAGSNSLRFVLTAPSSSDQVLLGTGTVAIGTGSLNLAKFQFDLSNLTGSSVGTYVLFDTSSMTGITGTLATTGLTQTSGGYNLTLSQGTDGNGFASLNLSVQVVPEPSTYLLALFSGGVLAVGFRRRARV